MNVFQKEGIHSCKSQFFHKNEYPHENNSMINLYGIKSPDSVQAPYNCWRIKPDFPH